MKKRTAAIAIVASSIAGFIAGGFAAGMFMKQYIIRIDSLNTAHQVLQLHRALRVADSGDLEKTQRRLDTALRRALFQLDIESDFHGCASAEDIVREAELYLKERQEKTEPSPGAYSSKAADGLTGNAQE